jgi:hypothetical protein
MVENIPNDLNKKLNYIIYGIIIGSSLIILITTGLEGENAFNAFMSAYGSLLCAIIFMFAMIWNRMPNINLLSLFTTLFPFVLLVAIITFLLVLLYKYSDRIIGNKVSNYYVTFMNTSTILVLVQLMMLMNALTDSNFENSKSIQPKIFSILILLGTINAIIVITLGVILKSYVTDG